MHKSLVIITGASSGIGAAVAKIFSEAGYATALLARNKNVMDALHLENSISIECDVTDINSVNHAINIAQEKFGAIDCLINNAGFAKGGEFTEVSHDDNQKMIAVNLNGVINCIETVLPTMQKNKSGTIINISSVADRKSRPTLPVYAATKAAVKSLSESLRTSNAKYGIRICNVAPAKIKTPLMMSSNLADDQIIQVQDMAKVILWIYEQPKTVCIRDIVIAPTYYEA